MYYHASEKQGLKFLNPEETKSTHLKTLKPYVFVTNDKTYAAGFCFPWSNNEGFKYGSKSETGSDWVLEIPKKFIDRLKNSCSLYYVSEDGFRKVYGVATPEFYKKGKVKIEKEEKYRTAAECLKKNGVTVRIK